MLLAQAIAGGLPEVRPSEGARAKARIRLNQLQSRVRTCEACGLSTMTTDAQCPACGSPLPPKKSGGSTTKAVDDSLPASDVTIDIKAEDVDSWISSMVERETAQTAS